MRLLATPAAATCGPYRKTLLDRGGVLQAIQTVGHARAAAPQRQPDQQRACSTGDTGYIWRIGAMMLGFSARADRVRRRRRVVRRAGGDGLRSRRPPRPVPSGHRLTRPARSAASARRRSSPASPTTCSRSRSLVVLATTMMVAAPLTMVIGIVLAVREDVGLSVVLLVAIPAP